MKFGGTFKANYSMATGSQDPDYAKDVILDEIARNIYLNPESVASALLRSGVSVPKKYNKSKLIDLTSKNLASNKRFQKEISRIIVENNPSEFSNAAGEVVSSISNAISGIFQFAQTGKQQKVEEERTKQVLYNKIFGVDGKPNYMPIILVSSVLLVGTIIAVITLRK